MKTEKYRLRYDASLRNGKRGIGLVIYDPDEKVIFKHHEEIKKNYSVLQLEMYAMYRGLAELKQRNIKKIKVRGDNIKVKKIIKSKREQDPSVNFIVDKINSIMPYFEIVDIGWIPRGINDEADRLSKIPTSREKSR